MEGGKRSFRGLKGALELLDGTLLAETSGGEQPRLKHLQGKLVRSTEDASARWLPLQDTEFCFRAERMQGTGCSRATRAGIHSVKQQQTLS